MAKKKHKTKIIYRTKKPVEPSFDKKKEELKKEIEELKVKKSSAPKGFKGFIQKGAINKAISERRKILRSERGSEAMKQRTKQVRSQIEFQKSRNELKELQEKNKVNFGDFGLSSGPKKQLKFEDLY